MGRHMMDEEDDEFAGAEGGGEGLLLITAAGLAAVRAFPVIWSPAESGAPAVYEFAQKTYADVKVYRHAMQTAEVLIQLGEMAPGRYEYDNPLFDGPAEFQPFIASHYAEVSGKRV